ncbi:hypothetical protein Sfum_1658 [Syntrophobacter fumaroxidans MPOB]|uniref:Uncharacterized protein n=1 Tax=Syntrophobacter fumaroxidans (strain DSM 10017 / MPOB) TaxID=335543 RepID=A0LIU3_SYNFM|nr:hypothetical protein Sfum_1658 [Syntrophobacter fumaroxidans MPOB]
MKMPRRVSQSGSPLESLVEPLNHLKFYNILIMMRKRNSCGIGPGAPEGLQSRETPGAGGCRPVLVARCCGALVPDVTRPGSTANDFLYGR